MISKEHKTKKVEVIKDILCNKCGNSCKKPHECMEFATLSVHWGYFSKSRDGEVHEAHLCQNCWEDITKEFKHSDLVAENKI